MKLGRSVGMGALIMIGANLLMSLGSIWVFMRMAPAIEVIIEQNERSLQACEEMLASLALVDAYHNGNDGGRLKKYFVNALENAEGNITEKEEPRSLEAIRRNFAEAFEGDSAARERTVDAIIRLGAINRDAMVKADVKARQVGAAGAWSVVFMATGVFLFGMLFLRSLKNNLINPFEEIRSVLSALGG